jgi:hypothetical protein
VQGIEARGHAQLEQSLHSASDGSGVMVMSGINTKASKIDRILSRQLGMEKDLENIFALMRLNHQTDQATIKLLTETARRLEAENARLRKYLGSVLFARRQREMQIPTLSNHFCQECLGMRGVHVDGCSKLREHMHFGGTAKETTHA